MIPADPLAKLGPATILRADARALPLPDASVDLVVTSPPYFGLRSYTDGGLHYDGQIGSETTPAEFVAALLDCTREMARVLKPSASLWVNLGDKYASYEGSRGDGGIQTNRPRPIVAGGSGLAGGGAVRTKSLMGIPWRYALACIGADTALADPDVVNLLLRDVALGVLTLAEAAQVVDDLADYDRWDLGLILRAEVIWSKPNGLPESVTDRVRRSHETWFHFVKQPRYFAGVDEIRDPLAAKTLTHGGGGKSHGEGVNHYTPDAITTHRDGRGIGQARVRRPDPRGAPPRFSARDRRNSTQGAARTRRRPLRRVPRRMASVDHQRLVPGGHLHRMRRRPSTGRGRTTDDRAAIRSSPERPRSRCGKRTHLDQRHHGRTAVAPDHRLRLRMRFARRAEYTGGRPGSVRRHGHDRDGRPRPWPARNQRGPLSRLLPARPLALHRSRRARRRSRPSTRRPHHSQRRSR